MGPKRALPFLVATIGVVMACQSGVPDSELLGTWTNDQDSAITMTLVDNNGSDPDYVGKLTGTLETPDNPSQTYGIDVRRDALDKPFFVIVADTSTTLKDIVCQGCNVTGDHMSCADALAELDLDTGIVKIGRSCKWTRTSAPSNAAGCSSVTVSQGCAIPGCPASTVSCAGGTCPPNSTCVSGNACQCNAGLEQRCCNGEECPSGECNSCPSDYWGCGAALPVGCSDSLTAASGTCECSNGPSVPFLCGTNSTCEQLCSGSGGGGADGGTEGGGDAGKE
jgi:hypothetical protein